MVYLHNQIQRLWYMGTMYRHERPQKGRYREFRQLGVEVFGLSGPDIDAELILLTARLWRELGLQGLRLEINSIGTGEERAQYRQVLVEYFSASEDDLDEDSRQRLQRNPLRILDSKNPSMQALIAGAPAFSDYLGTESKVHFESVLQRLEQAGIKYIVNPRLVRGLDYYNLTVFEWITDALGAQGTVCAGGRYDGLVQQLGGSATPAMGFAMGLERLISLLQQQDGWDQPYSPDIYVLTTGEAVAGPAMVLTESLRDNLPEQSIVYHCGSAGLKSQLKRADRSGAAIAVIIGNNESTAEQVTIKFLREKREQITIAQTELINFLRNL